MKVYHCIIKGIERLDTPRITVNIDFGQEPNSKSYGEGFLRGNNGTIIEFQTTVDAINYLTSCDWELIDSYAFSNSNVKHYHYVMKIKHYS